MRRFESLQDILSSGDYAEHSLFAPSGSAGWANCSAYLFANAGLPDTAGEDAAEGTVFHDLMQETLERKSVPTWRRGEVVKVTTRQNDKPVTWSFTIDDEMLDFARDCLDWVIDTPGEWRVETRVDFSKLTPIPGQKGTCDFAAMSEGRLVVRDWKYGKGVQVFIRNEEYDPNDPDRHQHLNSQVLLYVFGFFDEWDWLFDFQEIDIGIGQPRLDHWDTLTISRHELLRFASWIKDRAERAANPRATRSPSKKACQWCKDRSCAAVAVQQHRLLQGHPALLVGEVTQEEMSEVGSALSTDMKMPGSGRMTTSEIVQALRYRKMFEQAFNKMADELLYRAENGEDIGWTDKDGVFHQAFKLVEGRKDREWFDESEVEEELHKLGLPFSKIWRYKLASPNMAEEALKAHLRIPIRAAKKLAERLVYRPPGRPTLVAVSDTRPALTGEIEHSGDEVKVDRGTFDDL